jgi:vacuolar-type H+-ATPase subunit H
MQEYICENGVPVLQEKEDFIDRAISCESADLTPELFGNVQAQLRQMEKDLIADDNSRFIFPQLPNFNKRKKKRNKLLQLIMMVLRIISYVFMAIGLILALLRMIQILRRLWRRMIAYGVWLLDKIRSAPTDVEQGIKKKTSSGMVVIKKKIQEFKNYVKDAAKKARQAAEDQVEAAINSAKSIKEEIIQEVNTTFES